MARVTMVIIQSGAGHSHMSPHITRPRSAGRGREYTCPHTSTNSVSINQWLLASIQYLNLMSTSQDPEGSCSNKILTEAQSIDVLANLKI